MVLHPLGIPAGVDAEDKSATGKLVEARHAFGRDDRVVFRDQANSGAQQKLSRGGGRERQGNEWIVRVRIALGQLSARWKRCTPTHGNVGVLAKAQRFESSRLERRGELPDIDTVIGREVECPNPHGTPPLKMRSSMRSPRRSAS